MSDLRELLAQSGCSKEFIDDAMRFAELYNGDIDAFLDKVEDILMNEEESDDIINDEEPDYYYDDIDDEADYTYDRNQDDEFGEDYYSCNGDYDTKNIKCKWFGPESDLETDVNDESIGLCPKCGSSVEKYN